MEHIINLIGDIDEELFKEFSEQLSEIEANSNPATLVNINLNSEGGNAYDALAFSARMRLSPCLFNITAYGFVASAAVLVLASGDTRNMTKEAWVFVHEETAKLEANVVELENEIKHLRRMEDQWAVLLEELTCTKASIWTTLHKANAYLSADECKNLGLVDKII